MVAFKNVGEDQALFLTPPAPGQHWAGPVVCLQAASMQTFHSLLLGSGTPGIALFHISFSGDRFPSRGLSFTPCDWGEQAETPQFTLRAVRLRSLGEEDGRSLVLTS